MNNCWYRRTFAAYAAVVFVFVFLLSAAQAGPYDPPADYYNSATGTGVTLKNQLQSIMTNGQIQRTYGDFRYSAAITDADPNVPGNILLVYNRASVSGVWNLGGQLPWNREHVWPQSLQPGSANNGTQGNLGDPHALRPADTDINGFRGHRVFGFENTTGNYRTIGTDYFYPGDADRGDVARQLFYSTTRYASSNLTLVEGVPGNNQMGDLSSLLAWHYLDTPDDFELRRNQAIFSSSLNPSYYTNNRNAYIDRPEYVWSVFVDQANDSQIALGGTTVDSDGGSTLGLSLGRVLIGASVPATQTVTLNKSGSDGTYFSVTTSGLATSSVTGRYNAFRTGGTDSTTFDVGLSANTVTAGLRSGTVTIDNLDVTTGGGSGRGANDADDIINVTFDVLDRANPSFASGSDLNAFTYDFGSIVMGGVAPTLDFDLFNLESTTGFTAGLDLDSIFGTGDTSILTTDLQLFGGASSLVAGLSSSFTASLDTSTAGVFATVYTLSFSDEDLPGASSLGQMTLTLLGTVGESTVESADFDGDGDVDGDDFLTWQRGLLAGTTLAEGDASGDLSVDGLDLEVWQQQFAAVSPTFSSSQAVPEPSTTILCLLCLLMKTGLRFPARTALGASRATEI